MDFTEPVIKTSQDLSKRAYVAFYFGGKRIREYTGAKLGLRIFPNHASTLKERNRRLEELRRELHHALLQRDYPRKPKEVIEQERIADAQESLRNALEAKLSAPLSAEYKRDLTLVHDAFLQFMNEKERSSPLSMIPSRRIEEFLNIYNKSATYYMNKRRNLGVLFNVAGRHLDETLKAVKTTQSMRTSAALHQCFQEGQVKLILDYLASHRPNLHLCCMLVYFCWLRPHQEVRKLRPANFNEELTQITMGGKENKGRKIRTVFIPEYARPYLRMFLEDLDREVNIFTHETEPLNKHYFSTSWNRVKKELIKEGILYQGQDIYSFRHTAAVQAYRKSKDVDALRNLLGHSSITVTLKYLRGLGELSQESHIEFAPTL